jgi:hypothetical protein
MTEVDMQNAFTTISTGQADVICSALFKYSKLDKTAFNLLSVSRAIDLYENGNEDVDSLAQALRQHLSNHDYMTNRRCPPNITQIAKSPEIDTRRYFALRKSE